MPSVPFLGRKVFHGANKGPSSTLQLLYNIRGKVRFAAWGAIIKFSALAIDPFAQKVIRSKSRRCHDYIRGIGNRSDYVRKSANCLRGTQGLRTVRTERLVMVS